jgi:hypothetical protein
VVFAAQPIKPIGRHLSSPPYIMVL